MTGEDQMAPRSTPVNVRLVSNSSSSIPIIVRHREDVKRTKPEAPTHSVEQTPILSEEAPRVGKTNKPLTFTNSPFGDDIEPHPQLRQLNRTPTWRYVYIALLLIVDVAVMVCSLFICSVVKPSALRTLQAHMPVWQFTLMQCTIWVICLLICGSYHRHVMSEGYGLYTRVFNAALMTVIFTSCVVYMLDLELPRTSVIAVPVLACILETVARWLMRRLLHALRMKNEWQYDTVIVGSPDGIDKMLKTLHTSEGNGYRPIAVCPIAMDPEADDGSVIATPYHGHPVPGLDSNGHPMTLREPPDQAVRDDSAERELVQEPRIIAFNSHFPRTVERLGAQIVIVADVISRDNKLMHALPLAIESLGIEFALSIAVADIGSHRIDLDYSGVQPILVASLPQYSAVTRFVKRSMDIVGSLVALIISAPLIILPAAIAIKLEDHGPAFYKQKRIGRFGIPFDCYKLRSMRVDADKMDATLAQESGQDLGALFKVKDDPRITRVGHFIRKYSIDEFPQFFNVLKGDMSLVGPRPQREYEVATYGTLYSTRLLVRPGITGPWQISGRSDLSQEEAEQLDVSYIQRWSITGDLAILAKTVVAVLRHKGSY